jgi:hypothetical protein
MNNPYTLSSISIALYSVLSKPLLLGSRKSEFAYCFINRIGILYVHRPENHPATQPHPNSMIDIGEENE